MIPLRVSREPRALDAGSELFPDRYFGDEIGLDARRLGADVDAAEVFGLSLWYSPVHGTDYQVRGIGFEDVPGREGLVNVTGYLGIGDGVYRFSVSSDNARTWRTTDLRLPLADRRLRHGCYSCPVAVGPGTFRRSRCWTTWRTHRAICASCGSPKTRRRLISSRSPGIALPSVGWRSPRTGRCWCPRQETRVGYCADTCLPGRTGASHPEEPN